MFGYSEEQLILLQQRAIQQMPEDKEMWEEYRQWEEEIVPKEYRWRDDIEKIDGTWFRSQKAGMFMDEPVFGLMPVLCCAYLISEIEQRGYSFQLYPAKELQQNTQRFKQMPVQKCPEYYHTDVLPIKNVTKQEFIARILEEDEAWNDKSKSDSLMRKANAIELIRDYLHPIVIFQKNNRSIELIGSNCRMANDKTPENRFTQFHAHKERVLYEIVGDTLHFQPYYWNGITSFCPSYVFDRINEFFSS